MMYTQTLGFKRRQDCQQPGGPRLVPSMERQIAPAMRALVTRLEDLLDGRPPAEMFEQFTGVRGLYG